jgi:hypothetical protein
MSFGDKDQNNNDAAAKDVAPVITENNAAPVITDNNAAPVITDNNAAPVITVNNGAAAEAEEARKQTASMIVAINKQMIENAQLKQENSILMMQQNKRKEICQTILQAKKTKLEAENIYREAIKKVSKPSVSFRLFYSSVYRLILYVLLFLEKRGRTS